MAGEALEKVFPMAGASALGKAAHWRLDEVRVDAAADAEGAARDADVGRVEHADADVARGYVHEHACGRLVVQERHGGGELLFNGATAKLARDRARRCGAAALL